MGLFFLEECKLLNMQEMTELSNRGFALISNFNNCFSQESSMDFEISWRTLLGNRPCDYVGNSITGRGIIMVTVIKSK